MSPTPSQFVLDLSRRVASLDWDSVDVQLSESGYAEMPSLLSTDECSTLISCYDDDDLFRSRVVMECHQFGRGDYAYFAEPLPKIVARLRQLLYERLAPVANDWAARLGLSGRYPRRLDDYVAECAGEGQTKPTPLLLRYGIDGFNCLHRDRYGEMHFPIQAMLMLSDPAKDFEGGEFLLVENRARQQSRATVVTPQRGGLVLFAGDQRPVQSKRGFARASMRHGVSRLTRGERYALGLIFHNAE